jgi:hypothetical protein
MMLKKMMGLRKKGAKYDYRLQLYYLEMLSQQDKNEVMKEVQYYEYELDDLERIFRKSEHEEGLAYIYEKQGKYEEALGYFLRGMNRAMKEAIEASMSLKLYSNDKYCYGRFLQVIREVRLCVPLLQTPVRHQRQQCYYLYLTHSATLPASHRVYAQRLPLPFTLVLLCQYQQPKQQVLLKAHQLTQRCPLATLPAHQLFTSQPINLSTSYHL